MIPTPTRLLGRQTTRLLVVVIFCLLVIHFFYRSSSKPLIDSDVRTGAIPAADSLEAQGEIGKEKANLKSIV